MIQDEIFERNFPFWEDLEESDRELIRKNSVEIHFEANEPVHDSTDCTGLYIVNSGRLRVFLLSEEGKEVTLYRLSTGGLCMLSASCVIQSIAFDVFVEAEEVTDCVVVSASVIGGLIEKVPAVNIWALETTVTRFSDVMWVLQQIVFMSMDKRVAIFLYEETLEKKSDSITMTHEQIARHLGTAREVVSRMLKHFANDGILEVTRKEIKVADKKRLKAIAYDS